MGKPFIVGTASDRVYQSLFDAGIVNEPAEHVSRVVIDLKVGHPAYIYVQKFADDSLADVLLSAGLADFEEQAA